MMKHEMNKELLSALVDGELQGQELEQALAAAESDEGCANWGLYHLVGDVLRSPDLAHHSQHDLLTGLRAQLAQEPKPLQLQPAVLEQVAPGWSAQSAPVVALRDPAANASVFRWKVAASFASVAAVAALGWSLMGPVMGSGAQLAQAPIENAAQVVVATQDGEVLRDARLDALMANHQQYATRPSLQTPADFLRNASFEQAKGAR
jgi:sigma-E factor negative regulatory protein RseA